MIEVNDPGLNRSRMGRTKISKRQFMSLLTEVADLKARVKKLEKPLEKKTAEKPKEGNNAKKK